MRITGGKYSRRIVKFPKVGKNGEIRPAMDRMRESLFSILGNLEGYSFLDLFSGSGVVGIEAASRGADRVVLVEKDRVKKPVILENLKIIEESNQLYIMTVEKYLAFTKEKFDIIYLDPPFPMEEKAKTLKKVLDSNVLNDDATVIIHYPEEEELPQEIGNLKVYDKRKYGRSILLFYQYNEEA